MIKNINNFVIFGGSELAILAIKLLKKDDVNLKVITSPRQIDERFDNLSLRDVCNFFHVSFEIVESIDSISFIDDFSESIGFSFGAPWIFPKSLALSFGGGLYDFMCIDVPKYRGGAHHSWQILNKETKFAHCLQRIIGDLDTFHQGEIVLKQEFSINIDLINNPYDLFKIHLSEAEKFMKVIFSKNIYSIDGERPKLNKVRFYPFLNTNIQAFINWSWDSHAIVDFINAFSKPYCGAATFYRGKEVKILGSAKVLDEYCHPFAAGIIVNISDESIIVGANGRMIDIELDATNYFELGERLYTPLKKLDEAFSTNVSYGSSGIEVKVYNHD